MKATFPRAFARRTGPSAGLALLLATTAIAAPGDIDATFGSGGRTVIGAESFNVVEAVTAITQQADGRLLLARWVYYWPSVEDLSVVRLTAAGHLDQSFGGDGIAAVDLGVDAEGATDSVIQLANGSLVAAGRVASAANGGATRLGLVRYLANGAPDMSFGSRGVVIEDLEARHVYINALVELPDARLVVAGYADDEAGRRDLVVARFNANGVLDSTFGASGRVVVDFSGQATADGAYALALQPDGKLVAGGFVYDENDWRSLAVVRLTPDGAPDTTFGSNGRVTVISPRTTRPGEVGMQLQSDGRLVLAGQSADATSEVCGAVVASLNADGTPDATFGSSGVVELPLGRCAGGGSSIAVDPAGAVIVANAAVTAAGDFAPIDITVMRLTASGQLDATFGVNGLAIVDVGTNGSDISLVRQSDGKMVVATSEPFDWDGGGNFFGVARLLASGSSAGQIGFGATYAQPDETAGGVSLSVRRIGGSSGGVSLDFATEDGSARGGEDFTAASGTLTWMDGESADKTITIAIADDSVGEGTEYLVLRLSGAIGGSSLTRDTAFINILDDEPAPPTLPEPFPSPAPGSGAAGGGGGWGWLSMLVLAAALLRRAVFSSAARESAHRSGCLAL